MHFIFRGPPFNQLSNHFNFSLLIIYEWYGLFHALPQLSQINAIAHWPQEYHASFVIEKKNIVQFNMPNYTILYINSSRYTKEVQVKKVYIFVD